MNEKKFNLHAIARRIMKEHDFRIDFPLDALGEAQRAVEPDFAGRPEKDLTQWLWSSIDNDDSRDLDQVEYVKPETNGVRLYVGIANVDEFVHQNSALDKTARQNTTSVYTGIEIFPMLPTALSTDKSSLLEGVKRLAIVMELFVDSSGATLESSVYPAVVKNQAQLTYDAVAYWLEKGADKTSAITETMLKKIQQNKDLQDQLLLQDKLAQTLEKRRHEAGALNFGMEELRPAVLPTEEIHLHVHRANRATKLIENFMIAANQAGVGFLEAKNFPSVRRVVRTPKRWDRIVELGKQQSFALPSEPDAKTLQTFLTTQQQKDPNGFSDLSLSIIKLLGRGEYIVERPGEIPLGHFGLAVENYAHSTAPNRRYPDILTQRLLLAAFNGKDVPYDQGELEALARHCTDQEDAANKVERSVQKSMAAIVMSSHIGEQFAGTITGSSAKGVWARIASPPVEGRVQTDFRNVDVGANVSVRLVSVNPDMGFIDFALVGEKK